MGGHFATPTASIETIKRGLKERSRTLRV